MATIISTSNGNGTNRIAEHLDDEQIRERLEATYAESNRLRNEADKLAAKGRIRVIQRLDDWIRQHHPDLWRDDSEFHACGRKVTRRRPGEHAELVTKLPSGWNSVTIDAEGVEDVEPGCYVGIHEQIRVFADHARRARRAAQAIRRMQQGTPKDTGSNP